MKTHIEEVQTDDGPRFVGVVSTALRELWRTPPYPTAEEAEQAAGESLREWQNIQDEHYERLEEVEKWWHEEREAIARWHIERQVAFAEKYPRAET